MRLYGRFVIGLVGSFVIGRVGFVKLSLIVAFCLLQWISFVRPKFVFRSQQREPSNRFATQEPIFSCGNSKYWRMREIQWLSQENAYDATTEPNGYERSFVDAPQNKTHSPRWMHGDGLPLQKDEVPRILPQLTLVELVSNLHSHRYRLPGSQVAWKRLEESLVAGWGLSWDLPRRFSCFCKSIVFPL